MLNDGAIDCCGYCERFLGSSGVKPNNLLSDKDVAISNIAGYDAGYYDKIQRHCPPQDNSLLKSNAGRQARLEAGAQRTLEGVACTRLFGLVITLRLTPRAPYDVLSS